MLSLPPASTKDGDLEGETENNPVILYDKAEDFNQLLNVFYPKSVREVIICEYIADRFLETLLSRKHHLKSGCQCSN